MFSSSSMKPNVCLSFEKDWRKVSVLIFCFRLEMVTQLEKLPKFNVLIHKHSINIPGGGSGLPTYFENDIATPKGFVKNFLLN